MASNQLDIKRQQAMTLQPGHADAISAAKSACSGLRLLLRSLRRQ
jgi:hypothetical protein